MSRAYTMSRNQGRQELYDFMSKDLRPWIEETAQIALGEDDLVVQLQSGVVLCKLINAIRPNTITKIKDDDGLVFSSNENVRFFLEACVHKMGLKPFDVFQPTDLLQLINKLKVLQTIEALRAKLKPDYVPNVATKPGRFRKTSLQSLFPPVDDDSANHSSNLNLVAAIAASSASAATTTASAANGTKVNDTTTESKATTNETDDRSTNDQKSPVNQDKDRRRSMFKVKSSNNVFADVTAEFASQAAAKTAAPALAALLAKEEQEASLLKSSNNLSSISPTPIAKEAATRTAAPGLVALLAKEEQLAKHSVLEGQEAETRRKESLRSTPSPEQNRRSSMLNLSRSRSNETFDVFPKPLLHVRQVSESNSDWRDQQNASSEPVSHFEPTMTILPKTTQPTGSTVQPLATSKSKSLDIALRSIDVTTDAIPKSTALSSPKPVVSSHLKTVVSPRPVAIEQPSEPTSEPEPSVNTAPVEKTHLLSSKRPVSSHVSADSSADSTDSSSTNSSSISHSEQTTVTKPIEASQIPTHITSSQPAEPPSSAIVPPTTSNSTSLPDLSSLAPTTISIESVALTTQTSSVTQASAEPVVPEPVKAASTESHPSPSAKRKVKKVVSSTSSNEHAASTRVKAPVVQEQVATVIQEQPATVIAQEQPAPVLIKEEVTQVVIQEQAATSVEEPVAPVSVQVQAAPVIIQEQAVPIPIKEQDVPVVVQEHVAQKQLASAKTSNENISNSLAQPAPPKSTRRLSQEAEAKQRLLASSEVDIKPQQNSTALEPADSNVIETVSLKGDSLSAPLSSVLRKSSNASLMSVMDEPPSPASASMRKSVLGLSMPIAAVQADNAAASTANSISRSTSNSDILSPRPLSTVKKDSSLSEMPGSPSARRQKQEAFDANGTPPSMRRGSSKSSLAVEGGMRKSSSHLMREKSRRKRLSPEDISQMRSTITGMRKELRRSLFEQYSLEVDQLCQAIENGKISGKVPISDPRVVAMTTAWGIRANVMNNTRTAVNAPPVARRSVDSPATSSPGSARAPQTILDLIEMQNEPDFAATGSNEDGSPTGVTAGMQVRVAWDYSPVLPDEILLQQDDIITVTKVQPGGWWQGELDGTVGWFPSNYVKSISADQTALDSSKVDSAPISIRAQLQPSAPVMELSDRNRTWYVKYKDSQQLQDSKTMKRRSSFRSKKFLIGKAYDAQLKQKWQQSVSPEDYAGLTEKEIKRQEVIYELLKTEREYVKDLDTIIEVFYKPLLQKRIISAKDAGVLFSNIEQLLTVNQELLRLLEQKRETNVIIDDVSGCFRKVVDFFKLYTLYCSNHPYAIIKYNSINSKPFRKFIEDCTRAPECRLLDLPGFLIKPIQRICRYPILIKEILGQTSADTVGVAALTSILEKIETIVALVNEGTRQTEGVRNSAMLQRRFIEKINLATATRKLLREDTVYVIKEEDQKLSKNKILRKDNQRQIFLFNDLFVLAKVVRDDKLSLIRMQSYDSLRITNLFDSDDGLSRFLIENTYTQSNLIIVSSSPEIKVTWMRLGKRVLDEQSRVKIRDDSAVSPMGSSRVSRSSLDLTKMITSHHHLNEIANQTPLLEPTGRHRKASSITRSISFSNFSAVIPRVEGGTDSLDLISGNIPSNLMTDDERFPHGIRATVEDDLFAIVNQVEVATYYYSIEVVRVDDYNIVKTFKSYDDFLKLHMTMLNENPIESGLRDQLRTIPELPPQQVLVSYAVALERIEQLDNYLKELLRMPKHIAVSASLMEFLQPDESLVRKLVRVDARPKAAKRTNLGEQS